MVMKRIDSKILVLLVSGSLLLGILGIQIYRQKGIAREELLLNSSLQTYEADMIPLYKQKAELAEQILKSVGVQDSNVLGITAHTKKWQALSKVQIYEIEELNTHLDTWLSPHVKKLENMARQDKSLNPLLQQIRWVDQSLASSRAQLSSIFHMLPVTQN